MENVFPIVAKIKDRREIAKDTLWVRFDLQGRALDFKPGQYFFVNLINPPYNDERGARRHFSIVNSPSQKGVIEMTTRLTGSAFKKSLQEMPLGTEVQITAVAGKFILPEETDQSLVFIAGGIGITPFMSILRYVQEENLSYKITLIYSNKDRGSTAFLDELSNIKKENIKAVLTMTQDEGWTGEKRRVDEQLLKDYLKDIETAIFYIVGPPTMVDQLKETVLKTGVEETRVKIEKFTGYP